MIYITLVVNIINPSVKIRLTNVLNEISEITYNIIESLKPIKKIDINFLTKSKIVIFQRSTDEIAHTIFKLSIKQKKHIIYDIDDNFLKLPKYSLMTLTKKHKFYFNDFLSRSNHVVTATTKLKNYFKEKNSNISVIENTIKLSNWPLKAYKTKKKIRVLLSNIDYFKLLNLKKDFSNLLESFVAENKIDLYLIGQLPSKRLLKYKNVYFYEQIISHNEYLKNLNNLSIDFALVPLEKTEFHSYKSLIKFVEYSALGIIGIFSSVEPYINSSLKNKINAFLVNNSIEKWNSCIKYLLNDSSFFERMRKNAYDTIYKNYDIKYACKKWKKLINKVINFNKVNEIKLKEKNINKLLIKFKYQQKKHFIKLAFINSLKIIKNEISINDLLFQMKRFYKKNLNLFIHIFKINIFYY